MADAAAARRLAKSAACARVEVATTTRCLPWWVRWAATAVARYVLPAPGAALTMTSGSDQIAARMVAVSSPATRAGMPMFGVGFGAAGPLGMVTVVPDPVLRFFMLYVSAFFAGFFSSLFRTSWVTPRLP